MVSALDKAKRALVQVLRALAIAVTLRFSGTGHQNVDGRCWRGGSLTQHGQQHAAVERTAGVGRKFMKFQ